MEVQLLEHRPEAVVVGVVGEITHDTVPSFLEGVVAQLAPEDRHLVLDFSMVESWDSSGLRALVELARRVGRAGGRLVVVGAAKMPRTLAMTGLNRLITTASSLDLALAAVADTPASQ